MQAQRPFSFRAAVALAVALAIAEGGCLLADGRAEAQGNSTSAVLRTLVYHEISSLPANPSSVAVESPILSASGSRAAFCVLSYNPTHVAHIYLLNADGTGQPQEVDTYPWGGGGVNALDVSADGSTVISTHDAREELRIARADGRGGRPLVTLKPDLGTIAAIRLSSDGSLVFFILSGGNQPELADGTQLPRGLYVISADGSAPPRRITGIPEIARLLGLPENQFDGYLFGLAGTPSLAVSSRAPLRIAFATHIPPVGDGGSGQGVFAVNQDGSNLVSLTGRQGFASVAISGDGATVGYHIITPDGSADVIGVVGATGGTPRELVRSMAGRPAPFPTDPPFPSLFADRLQLSFDGAWFLLSSSGVLVNTTNPPYTLQLAMRGGSTTGDPAPILYDGLRSATMNDSATRFLYLAGDRNGVLQLATLDLNPGSLGAAPSITNGSVTPPFALTQGRSAAMISAQVSASGSLDQVGWAVVLNGLHDPHFNGDGILSGDRRAGSGIFTSGDVRADSSAVAGLRTVRIKAEARSADGRRHATAIEIAPFALLDQAPASGSTIEVPPSPTPAPAPPGAPGSTTTGSTTGGTGGTTGSTTTGGTTSGTATGGTTGVTTTGGTTGSTTTGGGTPSLSLTGLWTDPFAPTARFRIRQVGNQIYWCLDDLPHVTNVFQGTLEGDIITGQWVDLPGGELETGIGSLVLHVESNDRLVKIGESSPYGVAPAGEVWIRVTGGATPGGTTGGTSTTGSTGGTTAGTTSGVSRPQ